MSLIINPNEPTKIVGQSQAAKKSELEMILDTMRIIFNFRREYLDLHAQLQSDGVTERSAKEIEDINNQKQHVAESMVRFIVWGKV